VTATFRKVSVLVPTRGRTRQLGTLIQSFVEMTTRPESAELVFRVDVDDVETQAVLSQVPWPVVAGPRYDGYRSLPVFFEELRQVATGDLFMCGNDDMVFRTPDWSTLVLAEANRYPDGLFDLGVETLNAGVFPFSIVSRQAIDQIGFLQDPQLMWGDLFLRDVMATFGRAIRVPSVVVDHQWMGLRPDTVFTEGDQGNPQYRSPAYWQQHQACVAAAVAKLRGVSAHDFSGSR
jgi:hypothetical protein